MMFLPYILCSLFIPLQCGLTPPTDCATLYDLNNYGGSNLVIQPGHISCLAWPNNEWNDRISSLTVHPGFVLTAYSDCDFGGDSVVFSGDVPAITNNNEISSLKCVSSFTPPTGCATLYDLTNYGGSNLVIQPGDISCMAWPDNEWNDRVSSLTVSDGYVLTVYQHCNYGGISEVFFSDVPAIASNNEISSLKCVPSCKCGLARREERMRIFGGEETEVNEYPWMVAVREKNSDNHYCGGSLINDKWVLTAAHCMKNKRADNIQVILGDHDYSISGEAVSVRVDIQQILIHPEYFYNEVTGFEDYDAALLKMTDAIDFNIYQHIRPICLPEDPLEDYENFVATATGWGPTGQNEQGDYDPSSVTLQEMNVNVLTNAECRPTWSELPLSNMCSIGGGKGACPGDSGGPLVTSGNGNGVTSRQNYELIGIISQSTNCKEGEWKAVIYTKVTSLLSWITLATEDTWFTCPRS